MQNPLIIALQQSDINKLIIKKLNENKGKVGQISTDGISPDPLPEDMINGLNSTIAELVDAIQQMHSTFLANNIAVRSAEDYVNFMCDFIPAYFALADHAELNDMKKEEIEAIAIAQCAITPVTEKRRQLIANAYNNQSKLLMDSDMLTIQQVAKQFEAIDDGNIEDAYKTLLHSQLNAETQPQ